MRILDRYIGRQVLTATIIAVIVLSVVMVLGNVVKKLLGLPQDVLASMPTERIVEFVGYAIVASLPFTVPWSLLTASLLVFGRLSADNELISMRMAGRSFLRVCAPVIIMALLALGLCAYINLVIAPRAESAIKRLPALLATENPQKLLSEGKIIDQIKDFIIYVGDKKSDEELQDLHMIMMGPRGMPAGFVTAQNVRVVPNAQTQALDLDMKDATIIMRDEDANETPEAGGPRDPFAIRAPIRTGLISQTFSLGHLYDKLEKTTAGMMDTPQLWREWRAARDEMNKNPDTADKRPGRNEPTPRENVTSLLTELSSRFSFSLASLVFVLVGLPLGVTAQRRETSIGFALSLAVGIIYLALYIVGNGLLNEKPSAYPYLIVWLPNVLFCAIGLFLFIRMQRR
jgi:lipopolysaccharide export LptBFGC system permease protein LptF